MARREQEQAFPATGRRPDKTVEVVLGPHGGRWVAIPPGRVGTIGLALSRLTRQAVVSGTRVDPVLVELGVALRRASGTIDERDEP